MTNEILGNEGDHITWGDTGETHAMTMANLASGTGRQGVTHDFVAGVRVVEFWSLLVVAFETNPVFGQLVELWWKVSDGATWSNDDGEGDIALSSVEKLRNCIFGGAVAVDQETADIVMADPRPVYLPYTEVAPIVFVVGDDNLQDSATVNHVRLIPIPPIIADAP